MKSATGPKTPLPAFIAATVLFFFLSLSAADSIGFVPDYIDGTSPGDANELPLSNLPTLGDSFTDVPDAVSSATIGIAPERILIPAIGMDLAIQNPDTRDINALDALL